MQIEVRQPKGMEQRRGGELWKVTGLLTQKPNVENYNMRDDPAGIEH